MWSNKGFQGLKIHRTIIVKLFFFFGASTINMWQWVGNLAGSQFEV